jgi:DnaK suppressor protein
MQEGTMRKEDLIYFKDLLTLQLGELQNQADGTVMDLLNLETRATEFLDIAAIESDRAYTLRMRSRESQLIKKIKRSLEDIDEGTYGICQMCGEDISIERLKARPVARHCIVCKSKLEQTEKAAGF